MSTLYILIYVLICCKSFDLGYMADYGKIINCNYLIAECGKNINIFFIF